jgi:hypothetical protein
MCDIVDPTTGVLQPLPAFGAIFIAQELRGIVSTHDSRLFSFRLIALQL